MALPVYKVASHVLQESTVKDRETFYQQANVFLVIFATALRQLQRNLPPLLDISPLTDLQQLLPVSQEHTTETLLRARVGRVLPALAVRNQEQPLILRYFAPLGTTALCTM